MSKASELIEWLRQNPGRHLASAIFNGLRLEDRRSRDLYSFALRTLVEREIVQVEGHQRNRRYEMKKCSQPSRGMGMSAHQTEMSCHVRRR